MDLDAFLARLVAPLTIGAALDRDARLLRLASSSGWRLTFEDGGHEIHVEIEPRDPRRRAAVTTERLGLSYRVARAGAPIDPHRAKELVELVARLVAVNEARVLQDVAEEASRLRTLDDGGARVREVRVTRALEPMGTPEERFYGLSPYAGCVVGCRFCYADGRLRPLRRLQLLDDVPWGSYVDVRENVAEVLSDELDVVRPAVVKFCPILSDPYQAVEARYRLTRRCLEVLSAAADAPIVLVLTRTTLVLRDVDVLASMPRAHAGVSLPTLDDAVRRHFEPRAATIPERLEVLRRLRAGGARTFAIIQPILPGRLDALADALAETVSSVRIDVLYGVEGAERQFADPRYVHARDPIWQDERRRELAALLAARGVAVWESELPPE